VILNPIPPPASSRAAVAISKPSDKKFTLKGYALAAKIMRHYNAS